jgi:hypothetical protein
VELGGKDAFYDQHEAGAGWASVFDTLRWFINGHGAEQRAATLECGTAVPVGE